MLTQIIIRNFAIAEKIDQRFKAGTTVITGETGAGKSIILDALSLALGDRADSDLVRQGEKRAEIAATFDVSHLPEARKWLQEQDLDQGSDCILRRIITSEGRSRGYINGQPCSIQNLKIIGEMLIDIHGQHEHQSLLKKENHIKLMDTFGQLTGLADETATLFKKLNQQKQSLSKMLADSDSANAKRELLTYQVEELDQLGLEEGELEQLENEQQKLSQAGSILQHCQQALAICDEDDININNMLEQCSQTVNQISISSPTIDDAKNLLSDALIQLQEAASSLRHFSDEIDLDPARLNEVEDRLSAIYQLARKHKTLPETLVAYHQELKAELENMDAESGRLDELQEEIKLSTQAFLQKARLLSERRASCAMDLDKKIAHQLEELNMPAVVFKTAHRVLDENHYGTSGIDEMEFLVSTNPGQPPKPLIKIASGGELSRISLAIQVITAQNSSTPTLTFDEVDVGIGGATAEVVGNLLRKLGEQGQIICVTHQAQVAVYGHHHLQVSKHDHTDKRASQIVELSGTERVEEIARMMGGIKITDQTKAHAHEMLATASH